MRVTNNTTTQQFIRNIQELNESLQKSTTELSTGQRINKGSDDPTAASRVLAFQSDQRGYSQYLKNIDRATEISTATYDTVDSLQDILVSMEELAVGADDLTSPGEFTAKLAEINELIEQTFSTANQKYSGDYLFGGNATDAAPFTATRDAQGNITGIAYAGSTATSSFEIDEGALISPYSSPTQNSEIETMLNNMIALRDGFGAQDTAAIATARDALALDEDAIINQLSSHAAVQSRLVTAQNQIGGYSDALDERISSDADVDISEATVRYNEIYLSYQAALSAGSKMLSTSLLDYL